MKHGPGTLCPYCKQRNLLRHCSNSEADPSYSHTCDELVCPCGFRTSYDGRKSYHYDPKGPG